MSISVALSIIAVVVSLFTLWLTQLRRGRIVVAAPKLWSGTIRPDAMILLLPLAIANTGARPVVIRDLRLVFLDEQDLPLEFVRTRPELKPQVGQPSWAAPLLIPAHSVELHFCEFERKPGRPQTAGIWPVRLDAQRVGRRPSRWSPLLTFDWGIEEQSVKNLGPFITHRNAGTMETP